jgi:hypothetical protein
MFLPEEIVALIQRKNSSTSTKPGIRVYSKRNKDTVSFFGPPSYEREQLSKETGLVSYQHWRTVFHHTPTLPD